MRLALPPWLDALRPSQLAKNALVLAGFFFALPDRHQAGIDPLAAGLCTLAAAALFAVVSGAVYLLNDLHDAPRDRLHPEKRRRPIASGSLPVRAALAECALLVALSAALAPLLGRTFALVLGGYFAMQLAYTFALKRVPLLDVACIAAGFALRVWAGVAAAGVALAPAILYCTFCGALFLALCKRRAEIAEMGGREAAASHRPVLRWYPPPLLRAAIAAAALATLAAYSAWALAPSTAEKFGTRGMALTVPFVLLGLLRYIQLTVRGRTGRPEKVFLRDRPVQLCIALYLATCAAVWLAR